MQARKLIGSLSFLNVSNRVALSIRIQIMMIQWVRTIWKRHKSFLFRRRLPQTPNNRNFKKLTLFFKPF